MSIIQSIKQVLGLSGTASENHFWDGSVPNQLSLKRGTPEAPGAELIKVLNGALSFPNQGQSLTANGYVKLPGGLIVQWLSVVGGSGDIGITWPTPFPTTILAANVSIRGNNGSAVMFSATINNADVNGATVSRKYTDANQVFNAGESCFIIALGH